MKKYSSFEIDMVLDRLLEKWPNKTGEASARKAFDVAVKSGEDPFQIEKSADLYLMDNIGTDPDYIYRLGNFIREDHWKDTLELVSEDKMKRVKKNAFELIRLWNKACAPHWCIVAEPEARLASAVKALNDKAFNKHWRESLTKASKLFKYTFRDDNPFSKITLSFKWFTDISHDKHTVLRLVEGHYGNPTNEVAEKTVIFVKPDIEKMRQLAEEMEEFRSQAFGAKIIKRAHKKHEPLQPDISDAAKAIAEMMKSGLGKEPNAEKTTEVHTLVEKLGTQLKTESDPVDPFEFISSSSD